MDMLAVSLLILGLVALAVWARHLRGAKLMQIRKIIHEERMTAMEKGISFEDLDHEAMDGELAELNGKTGPRASEAASYMMWIRVAALCFGLLFLLGGIGVAAGFSLVDDAEFQPMWPIGIIPALIGLGLLLFYGLCRGYEKKLN